VLCQNDDTCAGIVKIICIHVTVKLRGGILTLLERAKGRLAPY
jgi:hypothetical protein